MPVEAIGVLPDTTTALPKNAIVSQEAFLKIMLTQLQNQDPAKPMDNQQFVAQLAQFSALEVNRQQSEKVDSLLTIQATNQAVALIGKQVELRSSGAVGTVTAISFATGAPLLTITSGLNVQPNVRLSDIMLITELNQP